MSRVSLALTSAFLLCLGSCSTPYPGAAAVPLPMPDADVAPPTGGYRGPYNNHDQSHADFCVRLLKPNVALRFADGTPSGFSLDPGILVPQSGSGVWCPERGMARLDAREFVEADDGSKMLFHRGGWGFAGNDPESAVHYGHLLITDIDTVGFRFVRSDSVGRLPGTPRGTWLRSSTTPWAGKGQESGNGSACKALSSVPLSVAVRSIPPDMHYLNSAQTSTIPYAIYGSPSTDLGPPSDRARGIRYTILQWSWINVRGGGVARALVRDGEKFYPCADVPAILLAAVSDARTRTKTGWVQATYGAIPGGGSGRLFGWIVSAHRHAGGSVVLHLTR